MPADDGKLFKKFKNGDVFIETGTYLGQGVRAALTAGFTKIYTIELYEPNYRAAVIKFQHNLNIRCLYGDSRNILESILLLHKDEAPLLWLDAHGSGPGTAETDFMEVLAGECSIIKRVMGVRPFILLIDDYGGQGGPGYVDPEHGIVKLVTGLWPEAIITTEDGYQQNVNLLRPDYCLSVVVNYNK